MAEPTVTYDASAGSDTAASGAGPATAITGSGAAHTGGAASTTITLTNSPDLSGVATDGTAAIWLQTASGRRLSKITSKDNLTKQVTVEDTFTIAGASAVDYAIGGKRQTLDGDGYDDWDDWKVGWVIEFEEGTYTNSDILLVPANGIVMKAVDGASTRPIITRAGTTLYLNRDRFRLEGLDIRPTAFGYPFQTASGAGDCVIHNCRFECDAGGVFWNTGGNCTISNCEFEGATPGSQVGTGVRINSGRAMLAISNCTFHDLANAMLLAPSSLTGFSAVGCIIHDIANDGIEFEDDDMYHAHISQCTLYDIGGSAIKYGAAAGDRGHIIEDCIISECGAYGVEGLDDNGALVIRNCIMHNCTSGTLDHTFAGNSPSFSADISTSDPLLDDPANGDFNLGSSSPAIGAGTRGQDIGALQGPGGGGGSSGTVGFAI